MCDDSFDLEEFETLATQPTVTTWSSQVAPKMRSFRTYGRRGSTGALPRSSQSARFMSTRMEEPLDCLSSPNQEELEFGQLSEIEKRLLPTFKPDAPTIPGRRRFTRANSMGNESTTSSSKANPVLRRSVSVSNSTDFSSISSMISSSQSSSSFSETGAENLHPNLDPLEEFASPKRSARPLDSRGRKKVRSAIGLSSLDRSASESSMLHCSRSFSNLARDEPSKSWAKPAPLPTDGCAFPPIAFNELEFLQSASPALSSVCSTRKRGICESPFEDFDDQSTCGLSISRHSTVRSRLLSPPPTSHQISEFNMESMEKLKDFSSHQEKYSKKSSLMDIASDDGESGVDSRDGMDSGDDVSVDGHKNRRSPVPTFVPFEQRQKRKSSMPTFPDTSIPETALHSGTASVDDVIESMPSYNDLKYLTTRLRGQRQGSVCWHVALPSTWNEARRRGFIQWITVSLGFTHRKAGAQAAYFQIPKSKGTSILKLLESSVAACKERGIGSKSPANANNGVKHFIFGATPHRKTPLPLPSKAPGQTTPEELISTVNGLFVHNTSNDLDHDLMDALNSMGMNDKPSPQNEYPLKTSIILEDGNDMALHEPRPSVENHSSSRDLMAHMHGLTPMPKPPLRRPRLSMGSVATNGTCSKFSAASPFPPAPLSTIGKNAQMKCFTHEFVETPMMKPTGWGSCPVEGRDWGASDDCEEGITQELIQRLNQALLESGKLDELKDLSDHEPRPFSLDLELEAQGEYRSNESSPESTSKRDEVVERGFFSQDTLSESSPSSSGGCFDRVDTTVEFQVGHDEADFRAFRRRQTAFAKHKRMSLFASAVNPAVSIFNNRKSLFVRNTRASLMAFRPSIFNRNLSSEHTFETETKTEPMEEELIVDTPLWHVDNDILKGIFSYLSGPELLHSASLVCTKWADVATEASAELMLISVGCKGFLGSANDAEDSDNESVCEEVDVPAHMDRPWSDLTATFPWARFLAEGGFKKVFKVFNRKHRVYEAVSVMDLQLLKDAGEINVVGAELAVSVMLSSLVRRAICPNFVVTRGSFSCAYNPPERLWGSEDNKCPQGEVYKSPKVNRKVKEPKARGRYQYIRMELCDCGDAEEYIKRLPGERFDIEQARMFLFQMAFALHAAANRFSLKHYDIKLLNYFVQSMSTKTGGDIVLRYGLGDHVFALRSAPGTALMAKLADYGTSNVDSATNGQQVTIAQFTTLENTPADFMILGDNASQGHGHDNFGLGLCMLHLFTGHAPYEEILEEVTCPANLKKRLRNIWECEDEDEFSVIRSVILSEVDKDEEGHILEGEPNEVLYDTFYRFLVLFGLPDLPPALRNSKVWLAVKECLEGSKNKSGRVNKKSNDINRYTRDCRKYSLSHGRNEYIARAREALQSLDGGMECLQALISFDPKKRFTALDVMNSKFMEPLREGPGGIAQYSGDEDIHTYTAFSTKY